MTKRHFEAIAAMFKAQLAHIESEDTTADHRAGLADATAVMAGTMATYFKTENPNFDRDKFMKACGL